MTQLKFRNMRNSGCIFQNLVHNPMGTWVNFLWPAVPCSANPGPGDRPGRGAGDWHITSAETCTDIGATRLLRTKQAPPLGTKEEGVPSVTKWTQQYDHCPNTTGILYCTVSRCLTLTSAVDPFRRGSRGGGGVGGSGPPLEFSKYIFQRTTFQDFLLYRGVFLYAHLTIFPLASLACYYI